MTFFRRKAVSQAPIVFLGDSITWEWARYVPSLFGEGRINMGIPGERTADMLARFERDVLQAKPRAIHLMGGTNDLWHTPSPLAPAGAVDNIEAMIRSARSARIAVYLASVPPIDMQVALSGPIWGPMIAPLNHALRALAKRLAVDFVDYASVLGPDGELLPAFSADGVHLTSAAYQAMGDVLRRAGLVVGGV